MPLITATRLRGAHVKCALCFIDLVAPGEQKLIPPVAEWQRVAKEVTHQS